MFYTIGELLEESSKEDFKNQGKQYVAVLTYNEWNNSRDIFDLGIDMAFRKYTPQRLKLTMTP